MTEGHSLTNRGGATRKRRLVRRLRTLELFDSIFQARNISVAEFAQRLGVRSSCTPIHLRRSQLTFVSLASFLGLLYRGTDFHEQTFCCKVHTLLGISTACVPDAEFRYIPGCTPSQRTFLARQSSQATAIFRRFALSFPSRCWVFIVPWGEMDVDD